MRKEVVTAPVTAATAFLLRETGLRGAPWPKLDLLRPSWGRSSDVTDIEGYASGSSILNGLDEDEDEDDDDADAALSKVAAILRDASRSSGSTYEIEMCT